MKDFDQVNTHFIFNAINSIRYYIKSDPDKAYSLLYDFSTYLRAELDSVGVIKLCPLENEIKYMRAYSTIEEARYPGRFLTEYKVCSGDYQIPMGSVIPFVNNAIRHGVREMTSGGMVSISANNRESYLEVTVKDNGKGFEEVHLPDDYEGGIEKAKKLIQSVGGQVAITSVVDKGTIVTIRFPLQND